MKTEIKKEESVREGHYISIHHAAIAPSKTNPRKNFNSAQLAELAESIRLQGIVQPLLVRPLPKLELIHPDLVTKTWRVMLGGRIVQENFDPLGERLAQKEFERLSKERNGSDYELVCGERRWRAAGTIKLQRVPAVVRELTDAQVIEIQYIENLQRADLSPLEEADGYFELTQSGAYTPEALATKLGKSRSHIYGCLKLRRLAPEARTEVERGNLDISKAGLILTVPDRKAQAELVKWVTKPDWDDEPKSFRALKEKIEEEYRKPLKDAPWDLKDEQLGGLLCVSCAICPKRSGNMAAQFPELARSPNVCTDVACYAKKTKTHTSRVMAKAKEEGKTVLGPEETEKAERGNTYLNLSKKNYQDPKQRTYGECLKAKGQDRLNAHTVIGVTDEGDTVQLAPKSVFRELGIKFEYESGRGTHSSGDRKAELAKAKLENAIADAVIGAAVLACEENKPDAAWWRVVAEAAAESCWHDSRVAIGKRRFPDAKNGTEASQLVAPSCEDMTEGQARGLVVEILCLRGMRGFWGIQEQERKMLKHLGIDQKKIEARVKEEMKAKKVKGKAAK